MKREMLRFGSGDAATAIIRGVDSLPVEEQARIFGWANGCPVVEELIALRGAKVMAPRYREVNMWFRCLKYELKKTSPGSKGKWLEISPSRTTEAGKHEPESVPDWYRTNIPPMGTLVGFALPRLLVEQSGTGQELPEQEVRRRTVVARTALREGAELGRSSDEVMVVTAEQIRRHGDLSTEQILQQILPANWLVEHPEEPTIIRFQSALYRQNGPLWRTYENLPPPEKKALALA